MVESTHRKFQLPDRTYQALVRSGIRKLAEEVGFRGHRLGELDIVIAEITSNLIKHTSHGGQLLVKPLYSETPGIEIICIDNGPGMKTPARMAEDGYSTKNTLGHGLGAISRLSDEFDLYTMPKWGTILLSRVYIDKKPKKIFRGNFLTGAINVCKEGEIVSGDAYCIVKSNKMMRIAMIDGLGHGVSANKAAIEAVTIFEQLPRPTPVDQLRSLHESLRKTRGIVITIAQIDIINRQITYSGVGNITMKVVAPARVQGCFSYNGIVGHIMPAVLNNHSLKWNDKTDMVVMHSDGLTARWDMNKYPGILNHHPLIIAAALYKDHDRKTDDASILVGRFIN